LRKGKGLLQLVSRFGKQFSSACRKTELCERKEDASDLFFNDSLALQDVQRDEFENIPGFTA